jgi:ABC-type glycerol-3-phosphate transport system substrate-binding protein
MPQGPAGSRGMFEMDANVMFSSSSVGDATWEYLKTLSTKEAGIKIAQAGSVPGGRPDVWEDPILNDYPPHAVFTEVTKTIDPLVVPNNFRYQELEVIAKNELDPVWLGEERIDDMIDDLTTALQQTMDMPRL